MDDDFLKDLGDESFEKCLFSFKFKPTAVGPTPRRGRRKF